MSFNGWMIQMTLFGTVFSHGQDILHHSRTNTNGDRHMTRRKTTCRLCDVVGRQAVWTQADHCISCADIGDIGLFISAIAAAVINCHLVAKSTGDKRFNPIVCAVSICQQSVPWKCEHKHKTKSQETDYNLSRSIIKGFHKKMQSHDCYLLPLLRNWEVLQVELKLHASHSREPGSLSTGFQGHGRW